MASAVANVTPVRVPMGTSEIAVQSPPGATAHTISEARLQEHMQQVLRGPVRTCYVVIGVGEAGSCSSATPDHMASIPECFAPQTPFPAGDLKFEGQDCPSSRTDRHDTYRSAPFLLELGLMKEAMHQDSGLTRNTDVRDKVTAAEALLEELVVPEPPAHTLSTGSKNKKKRAVSRTRGVQMGDPV